MLDLHRVEPIRLLGLDVDGVLTDNAVWMGTSGIDPIEAKRFDVQDGLGHALLRGSGIDVIWVTGRKSADTARRGEELRVSRVLQVHHAGKVAAIDAELESRRLTWSQLAFVGDDFADLPVLQRAGLAIAVANAREEIKAAAHHVTTASGGHGAVREVIDALLKLTGRWDAAVARYLDPSGAT
jgi:3-deoxy-D-manno-octulosonate 8-phosphate phosphatase (KDO 8-P phosphatase)